MKNSLVLVTGANGSTGSAAIKSLQGTGTRVRAMVYVDDYRADSLREMGAETVVGDLLDIDSLHRALQDVDAAYFVYPVQPRLIEATAYFAQAARENEVKSIVNLSQRTARRDSGSHAARDHWIAERVFDWSGVPVTHLRPTLFADWLLYDFARQGVIDKNVLALPFGDGQFAPLAAEDQGRVIAAILSDPEPHKGKTYFLNGLEVLNGEQIAAALGEGLGREVRYVAVPIADFQAVVREVPRLSDFFAQHMGAVVDDLLSDKLSGSSTAVEDITGLPPMSVQEFARLHAADFTRGA